MCKLNICTRLMCIQECCVDGAGVGDLLANRVSALGSVLVASVGVWFCLRCFCTYIPPVPFPLPSSRAITQSLGTYQHSVRSSTGWGTQCMPHNGHKNGRKTALPSVCKAYTQQKAVWELPSHGEAPKSLPF